MHDRAKTSGPPDPLRAGLRISLISIGWTVISSSVSIVLGLRAASLVLVAFGMTGLLDAAGSFALVSHFRHALRHEAFSEARERLALRVVTLGLVVVGLATGLESVRRLIAREPSHSTPAGTAIAAASIVVLALLSHRKRQIADQIPSPALRADGWLSGTGCLLALVAVAGTGLTSAFGWWWVDPLAAAFVACGALVIGLLVAEH